MNTIMNLLCYIVPHFRTDEYYANFDSSNENFIIGVPFDPEDTIQTKYDYIVSLKYFTFLGNAYFITVGEFEQL